MSTFFCERTQAAVRGLRINYGLQGPSRDSTKLSISMYLTCCFLFCFARLLACYMDIFFRFSSARCCSCMRLEPKPRPGGEGPFAELSDKRMLCMSCAQVQ